MRNYITEFIGTFFLVLAIAFSGDPLIIGITLMVMVYMGGHISGAHYNPAVSIAMIIRGLLTRSEAIITPLTPSSLSIISIFSSE